MSSPSPLHSRLVGQLNLDPDSFVPLYEQLKEQLRRVLENVEPGVLMPSERELLELTGIGRVTVRRSIGDLVQEGLLISRKGRGTYTAPRRVEPPLEPLAGFTESMVRIGHTPSTEIRDVHVEPVSARLADALGLQPNAEIYVIERIRLIDGAPAMVEQCHLGAAMVPGLQHQDLTGSLYEVLADVYNLRPVDGTESVVAVNADTRTARLLDVPVAAALLSTTRRTYTRTGLPIEYTLRHARGDLWSFRVKLHEASEFASVGTDAGHFGVPRERSDT